MISGAKYIAKDIKSQLEHMDSPRVKYEESVKYYNYN